MWTLPFDSRQQTLTLVLGYVTRNTLLNNKYVNVCIIVICPIAIACSMGQISKSVCVCHCVCVSICGHSHEVRKCLKIVVRSFVNLAHVCKHCGDV